MKKDKTLQEHFVVYQNLIFIGIVLLLLAKYLTKATWWWIPFLAGLGCCIAAAVYHKKYIKCPHCGSNRIGSKSKFCPECGKKLD